MVLFILVVSFAFAASAESRVNKSFLGGLAIKGYDSVGYFEQSKPVKGSDDFEVEWHDATWQFSSARNRDLFKSDPEKYAPQFGGYCAFAVSKDHVQKSDPTVWSIVDDKLYLNLGPGAQSRWQEDVPGNIIRASSNWPGALIDPGKRPKSPAASEDR